MPSSKEIYSEAKPALVRLFIQAHKRPVSLLAGVCSHYWDGAQAWEHRHCSHPDTGPGSRPGKASWEKGQEL